MKKILTLSIFCLFLTVFNSAFSQNDLDVKYAAELLKPGTPAPDFQLTTTDGKTLKFSDFAKGKYVVLDFWASWANRC